ncbi:hypothetical protein Hamer_G006374 [Homarus americanus]|uniref:Uncharacterized protein n=1 Tax=Homarus americanus TaxID=6706 RepID=A0A8J5JJ25_HOMAM|nr:hypothetical protein Hamer_G006374 [Homarus americanus]
MLCGTAKKRKCYPLHYVFKSLSPPVRNNLVSFHSLIGSDTVSSFSGPRKNKRWKVFSDHSLLLHDNGRDGDIADVEKFVCFLYGTPEQHIVDDARVHLLGKAKKTLEMLLRQAGKLSGQNMTPG